MTKHRKQAKPARRRFSNLSMFIVIVVLILGIPFLILSYQARKSGMSISEVVQRKIVRSDGKTISSEWELADQLVGERIDFLVPQSIGDSFTESPMISHVIAEDLDQDGLLDVVVCDAKKCCYLDPPAPCKCLY